MFTSIYPNGLELKRRGKIVKTLFEAHWLGERVRDVLEDVSGSSQSRLSLDFTGQP
jgi:hypothetical protein